MNFILGTATFGTGYGIANSNNALNELEVFQILQEAKHLGIALLDTAPAYGKAEEMIGRFHNQANTFGVISKISEVYDFSSVKIVTELKKSASKLRISKFSAILFHKPEMLANYPKQLVNETIEKILSTGLVDALGVSVYDEEDIRFISENFPKVTLFQVPENIMDRRLLDSTLVKRLANQGVKFHIRSVFLQGLLMMKSESVSTGLYAAKFGLSELEEYSKSRGLNVLDACLSYASKIEWASGVVVGVNSKSHLQEIVNCQKSDIDLNKLPNPFVKSILDPRGWAFK
jgi:aryl-alcohol dehydrogenase-like predicted oxidoreductase